MRRSLLWGACGVTLIAATFAVVQIRSAARASLATTQSVAYVVAAPDFVTEAQPVARLQTVSHERAAPQRPQTTIPRSSNSSAPVLVSPNPFESAAVPRPHFGDPFSAPQPLPADGFQPVLPFGSADRLEEQADVPVDALSVVLTTRQEQLRAAFERKLKLMLASEMDVELATLQTEIRELQAQTEFRKIQERLIKLQAELPETGPARAAIRMLEVPVSRAIEQKLWVEESSTIPMFTPSTGTLPASF